MSVQADVNTSSGEEEEEQNGFFDFRPGLCGLGHARRERPCLTDDAASAIVCLRWRRKRSFRAHIMCGIEKHRMLLDLRPVRQVVWGTELAHLVFSCCLGRRTQCTVERNGYTGQTTQLWNKKCGSGVIGRKRLSVGATALKGRKRGGFRCAVMPTEWWEVKIAKSATRKQIFSLSSQIKVQIAFVVHVYGGLHNNASLVGKRGMCGAELQNTRECQIHSIIRSPHAAFQAHSSSRSAMKSRAAHGSLVEEQLLFVVLASDRFCAQLMDAVSVMQMRMRLVFGYENER